MYIHICSILKMNSSAHDVNTVTQVYESHYFLQTNHYSVIYTLKSEVTID